MMLEAEVRALWTSFEQHSTVLQSSPYVPLIRRLRHYLQDWAPLQELAENLDAQLQHAGYLPPGVGPYGAWTVRSTLRDMLRFIFLGFELGARQAPPATAWIFFCVRLRRVLLTQLVCSLCSQSSSRRASTPLSTGTPTC